ncbi:hypothetical protein Y032_0066g3708 [Ancylostoma ceylanicum]|uniref:Uncharacterized protein n=1 Tax=Ancylostoma ceylanicum TaxID=53326 RepID=A0A016U0F2_9BILA|nr:hypothetical protein Y032_0066g3708 [Ancylostoma ceylanicum]
MNCESRLQSFRNDGADEAVCRSRGGTVGLAAHTNLISILSLRLVSFFKYLQSFLPLQYIYYHNFSIH